MWRPFLSLCVLALFDCCLAATMLLPADYVLAQHPAIVAEQHDAAVSVRGRTGRDPVVIELGTIAARPSTDYTISLPVTAVRLLADVGLCLMVRDHQDRQTRPLPDYHKTPAAARKLTVDQVGRMCPWSLSFTTADSATYISVALVITDFDGDLQLGAASVSDLEADYQTMLAQLRETAARRQRLVPRALVFSRAQMKYGLGRCYDHVWTDRPLFVDRSHRQSGQPLMSFSSYQRTLAEVVQYGIDGLAFFPETKGRMSIFEMTARAAVPEIRLLPEFVPSADFESKSAVLEAALAAESTVRTDGKILITSYVASALAPAQWAELLAALRAKHGDSFIFLPALTDTVALRQYWLQGQRVPPAEIAARQAYLRSYLDVCDGIYFNYPAAFKRADHTFDDAFYREIFIPVFKSVLSEPRYAGKYFGLSAYHSHSNPDLSIGLLEDGTRTLRRSFETAMAADPDVIVLPEWDEVNENTCFRPTVCNSTTSQRLLRYYMSRIKGTPLTPLTDDDPSLPNLIVSMRKIVTLGEPLVVELLQVPDQSDSRGYSVQLSLTDEQGQTIHTFEPVVFDAAELQAERCRIATEAYPAARAVRPRLAIRGYRQADDLMQIYDGLPQTQIRTTWNWDYKTVKQPLRELLPVRAATLSWAARDGQLRLAGEVTAEEDLALVEVIADGDEVYSVSGEEFLRADDRYEVIRIEYRSARSQQAEGFIELIGADGQWLLSQRHLHQSEPLREVQGNRQLLRGQVSPHQRWTGLAIPRDALGGASLRVHLNDIRIETTVSQILARQMIAGAGQGGLHVAVYPYRRTLDMPRPVAARQVTFDIPVWPWCRTEQYHLRLTSRRGRTYRSGPLCLAGRSDEMTDLRVYSEITAAPLSVPVSRDRVPDLVYDFEPARGAVLLTAAGHGFWASLGGFPDTTSGRGGRHSASMFNGDSNGYPANATRTAPTWVMDAGAPALAFDGIGTFLHLPREALPRRGPFTVTFEIKPTAAKDAYLLLHRSHRPASLALSIRGGRLHLSYFAAGYQNHELLTTLSPPLDQWSTVSVRRDFETLQASLGDAVEELPLTLPGMDIGPIVFGGFGDTARFADEATGNPSWFKGLMRGLRIQHDAR